MSNDHRKTPNLYTNDFLLTVNPYIRLAYYHTLDPNRAFPERIIYDYEIVLIKSGTGTITIEDHAYDAGPGDLFIFRPGQRHSFSVNDTPLVQPHIHFDLRYSASTSGSVPISFKLASEMTADEIALIRPDELNNILCNFPSHIHLQNSLYIEQLLFDVINIYRSAPIFPEIKLKWSFLRLLDQLICEINWQNSDHLLHKEERANLIKQYLDHHTTCQVNLDELSKVYHVDKSYISRIFQEIYGITPMRYHLLQRIEKAKLLIRYTNLSLTQIAEETGFSSLQDFSRAFRRVNGTTPSEYRK